MIGSKRRATHQLIGLSAGLLMSGVSRTALSATAADLDREATASLQTLYRANPTAENIAKTAKTILVFPRVVRAGLVFGGGYGEGVQMQAGKVTGYYNSVSGSMGLQAGAERYAYALFLMSDQAIEHLERLKGWEVGIGPAVVVVNTGIAKTLSTSTARDDVYAFVYDQKGLMLTLSIEGTKISHIKR